MACAASAAGPSSGPFGSAAAQSQGGPHGQRSGSWRVAGAALTLIRGGRTRSSDAATRRSSAEGSGEQSVAVPAHPSLAVCSQQRTDKALVRTAAACCVVLNPRCVERRPAANAVPGGLYGAFRVGTVRPAVARLRPAAVPPGGGLRGELTAQWRARSWGLDHTISMSSKKLSSSLDVTAFTDVRLPFLTGGCCCSSDCDQANIALCASAWL